MNVPGTTHLGISNMSGKSHYCQINSTGEYWPFQTANCKTKALRLFLIFGALTDSVFAKLFEKQATVKNDKIFRYLLSSKD